MLSSKQRANLRSQANEMRDHLIIGKGGLTPSVIDEINIALYNNELIKISVLKNCDSDIKEMAHTAARMLYAEVVQVIGGKFVLYKITEKEDFEHIKF